MVALSTWRNVYMRGVTVIHIYIMNIYMNIVQTGCLPCVFYAKNILSPPFSLRIYLMHIEIFRNKENYSIFFSFLFFPTF